MSHWRKPREIVDMRKWIDPAYMPAWWYALSAICVGLLGGGAIVFAVLHS